jgi:hypothetical protein
VGVAQDLAPGAFFAAALQVGAVAALL